MAWWENDPRYGMRGWTLIHDADGSRFVPWPGWYFQGGALVEGKRRKRPRALRFGQLEAGAVLVHRGKVTSHRRVQHPPHVANDDWRTEVQHYASFHVVAFRWFDPCAGQDDPLRGEMAAVARVSTMGQDKHLVPHTLRGLASQGYHYASPDQAERVRAFVAHRAELVAAFDAGEITREEAQLRAWPYRDLVKDLA